MTRFALCKKVGAAPTLLVKVTSPLGRISQTSTTAQSISPRKP